MSPKIAWIFIVLYKFILHWELSHGVHILHIKYICSHTCSAHRTPEEGGWCLWKFECFFLALSFRSFQRSVPENLNGYEMMKLQESHWNISSLVHVIFAGEHPYAQVGGTSQNLDAVNPEGSEVHENLRWITSFFFNFS